MRIRTTQKVIIAIKPEHFSSSLMTKYTFLNQRTANNYQVLAQGLRQSPSINISLIPIGGDTKLECI